MAWQAGLMDGFYNALLQMIFRRYVMYFSKSNNNNTDDDDPKQEVWEDKVCSSSSRLGDIKIFLPVWPDWAIYWTLGKFLKPSTPMVVVRISQKLMFCCKRLQANNKINQTDAE